MESMALEEFVIDLCEESAHGALLTFWLFQSHLHDLAKNPQSAAFKTCRRIYNKVQHIVFGAGDIRRREKIYQNVLPVTVLSAVILGSVAVPQLSTFAGPMAISQARRPIIQVEERTEISQNQNPPRSNTLPPNGKLVRGRPVSMQDPPKPKLDLNTKAEISLAHQESVAQQGGAMKMALQKAGISDPRGSSTPDVRLKPNPKEPSSERSSREPSRTRSAFSRRHSHQTKGGPSPLSDAQKARLLRSNYFRCETQFIAALENISNRLVQIPKPARLSALRAELALVNNDLSVEVDIPVLCPATLVDGSPSRTRHHRVVRINGAEATVLNSAEKVPYLLMIEILRDDFDFNPSNPNNEGLLIKLQSGTRTQGRIFDLLDQAQLTPRQTPQEPVVDSVFEPATGDLANASLIDDPEASTAKQSIDSKQTIVPGSRTSSGPFALSTATFSTPRTSEMSSRESGDPARKKSSLSIGKVQVPDQHDFSALATHIRTAAMMLAQLDASGSKRPREEVAAIKAKIIESMQELEDQNFDIEEPTHITFEPSLSGVEKQDTAAWTASPIDPEAGAARMENDQKTGGVKRTGDRDDPSAAMFGEEWTSKKERIKKSSPYGWMKNWDLLSVIIKTGADLRQEAFACQLIQVCEKIWMEAKVDVWVRNMRILVTGESSGLIETITNGVSLHSLKRSLTIASVASGNNPRGRIATLKDHFTKVCHCPQRWPSNKIDLWRTGECHLPEGARCICTLPCGL
jgi:hypothetical protein